MEETMIALKIALILMFLLFTKHFIADFLLQTNDMVRDKGIYGKWNGILHSLIHAVFTFVAIMLVWPVSWLIPLYAAIFDFIVHYHIDWLKININKKKNYTPQDKQFWFYLGADQFLHAVTYILIVAWYVGVL